MKITSKKQKPKPHPFYGEYTERGIDPFHRDAFPEELKDVYPFPSRGKRKSGWFLLDNWGNQIGFVPDGTKVRP